MHPLTRTTVVLALALTALACRTVEPPATRDIDAFVANVVRTIPEVPSIAVAVVHDGRRHASAAGYADVERQVLADARTGYYIGSTTKAFTGLVAARLAERGTIDLDAPIAKYLPEVRFKPEIDTKKLTLRRLLSHTGTIDNWPIVYRTAFTGEHSPAALIRLLDASKPRAETFRYDNLGYVVAGLIFERVTGKSWQQLHEELVFKPLRMSDTTAYMSAAKRLAMPYELLSSGRMELLTYRKNDRMMHAAGGTVMTAEDLARWLEANLAGGSAIAETHKPHATVERARGPFSGTAYGFGWYRGTIGKEPLLFHGGGFEGWRALFSFMPDRKLAVGMLTSSGIANPVNALVTSYAYDRLLGKPHVESEYAAKLATLRAEIDRQKAAVVADTQKRAARQWQLRHDRAAYAGRYESPSLGTMVIEERDGALYASLGTMRAPLEPFTEPESARVELIPASGEILRFTLPEGLKFGEELFTRKP